MDGRQGVVIATNATDLIRVDLTDPTSDGMLYEHTPAVEGGSPAMHRDGSPRQAPAKAIDREPHRSLKEFDQYHIPGRGYGCGCQVCACHSVKRAVVWHMKDSYCHSRLGFVDSNSKRSLCASELRLRNVSSSHELARHLHEALRTQMRRLMFCHLVGMVLDNQLSKVGCD
jgi:hypothetical protein